MFDFQREERSFRHGLTRLQLLQHGWESTNQQWTNHFQLQLPWSPEERRKKKKEKGYFSIILQLLIPECYHSWAFPKIFFFWKFFTADLWKSGGSQKLSEKCHLINQKIKIFFKNANFRWWRIAFNKNFIGGGDTLSHHPTAPPPPKLTKPEPKSNNKKKN